MPYILKTNLKNKNALPLPHKTFLFAILVKLIYFKFNFLSIKFVVFLSFAAASLLNLLHCVFATADISFL